MASSTDCKYAPGIALGIFGLLLSHAAGAATVQLGALQDNSLYAEAGDRSNGAGPAMFAGVNGQGFERRALVAFDISSLPANATINSVTLTLFATSVGDNGAGTTVKVQRLTSDWGEGLSSSGGDTGGGGSGAPATSGDATWTHNFFNTSAWTTAGGDFTNAPSAAVAVQLGSNAWSSAQLAADVQGWLDGSTANYGWLLSGDTSASSTVWRFGTRENGISGYQPLLTVDYSLAVPLPAAVWLLATGITGLLLTAHRR